VVRVLGIARFAAWGLRGRFRFRLGVDLEKRGVIGGNWGVMDLL
jgi:hypothetical protein